MTSHNLLEATDLTAGHFFVGDREIHESLHQPVGILL